MLYNDCFDIIAESRPKGRGVWPKFFDKKTSLEKSTLSHVNFTLCIQFESE